MMITTWLQISYQRSININLVGYQIDNDQVWKRKETNFYVRTVECGTMKNNSQKSKNKILSLNVIKLTCVGYQIDNEV